MRKLVVLSLAVLLCSSGVAQAATYYVSKSGRDTNSGTEASPFLTINEGVSRLSAGDTLFVKDGVYAESLINNIPSGQSWSNKVRIAAFPGDTVWMTPSAGEFVIYLAISQQYIEFDGINMEGSHTKNGLIKIEGWSGGNAHHIRFKNAEMIGLTNTGGGLGLSGPTMVIMSGAAAGVIGGNEFINLKMHSAGGPGDFAYAFYVQSSNNLIDGCEIYDTSSAGIQIYNGYGNSPDNNIIRNTRIHDVVRSGDSRYWGVIVAGGSGNQIYNTVISRIGGIGATGSAGIMLYSGSGTLVFNNTIYGGTAEGVVIEPGTSSAVVRNNISYQNSAGNYRNNGTGTVASNNLFSSDPQFVNAAAANFQLQSQSPAIDAAMILSQVPVDAMGTARPQGASYDIGAYEYNTGQPNTALLAPSNVHVR